MTRKELMDLIGPHIVSERRWCQKCKRHVENAAEHIVEVLLQDAGPAQHFVVYHPGYDADDYHESVWSTYEEAYAHILEVWTEHPTNVNWLPDIQLWQGDKNLKVWRFDAESIMREFEGPDSQKGSTNGV